MAAPHTPDGMQPLHGSFYSPDIADYYVTPDELGYGPSISFDRDFLGRDALRALRDADRRHKVTLVLNADDVQRVLGADHGIVNTLAHQRVERGGESVGVAFNDPYGTMLSLALLSEQAAVPGTEVTVVWGDHPGGEVAPDADLGLPVIRAAVQPCPLQRARAGYRRN
ncbi:hypothetical protein [Nocardia miyunensis]|uniref:hypothetical protein n=1 Tax=Nocardia miyunensis TaxID=282684 RepID=UPI0014720EEB|nr:hypothetical protein [Nocardia miyunensis]